MFGTKLLPVTRKQLDELAENPEFIAKVAETLKKHNECDLEITETYTEDNVERLSDGHVKSQQRVKDSSGKWVWLTVIVVGAAAGAIICAHIIALAPVTAPIAMGGGMLMMILILLAVATAPKSWLSILQKPLCMS